MNGHWPLGRGSYARSWIHLGLALAVAVGVGAIHWSSGNPSLVTGLAMVGCRPWALALGLVALINAGALAAFRPAPLRLLLPTPASDPELFRRLDPLRVPWIWLVPAAFAALAVLPARTEKTLTPWLLPAFLHAALLLYALLPLALQAGLAWRKAVVPHGHLIVWAVALLEASGLPLPGAGHLLLGGRALQIGWIPSLVALILLGILTRRIYARLAPRSFVREELLDYAYPVLPNPEARRHDLLLEVWGNTPTRRRRLFLLQLVTGLHRPGDLLNAAIAWLALVMVAGSVAGLYPPGGIINFIWSVSALGIALLMLLAGTSRRRRAPRGFPLPVGERELKTTAILVANILFAAGGAVTGTIQMVAERVGPAGDPGTPWAMEAWAMLTFVSQGLLCLNAMMLLSLPRSASPRVIMSTVLLLIAFLLGHVFCLCLYSILPDRFLMYRGITCDPVFATGYQILLDMVASLIASVGATVTGEEVIAQSLIAYTGPSAAVQAAAWLIPGLACLLSWIGFVRRREDSGSPLFFGADPIQIKTTSGEVKIPLFKT